jgi:hypothetical protein
MARRPPQGLRLAEYYDLALDELVEDLVATILAGRKPSSTGTTPAVRAMAETGPDGGISYFRQPWTSGPQPQTPRDGVLPTRAKRERKTCALEAGRIGNLLPARQVLPRRQASLRAGAICPAARSAGTLPLA